MKTTHTRGPWKFERGLADGMSRVVRNVPGELQITEVARCIPMSETFKDWNVAAANARLIAAAPDLLEALQCVLAALSQNATFPADIDLAKSAARSAIIKALPNPPPKGGTSPR